jgi:hypothetical protein
MPLYPTTGMLLPCPHCVKVSLPLDSVSERQGLFLLFQPVVKDMEIYVWKAK